MPGGWFFPLGLALVLGCGQPLGAGPNIDHGSFQSDDGGGFEDLALVDPDGALPSDSDRLARTAMLIDVGSATATVDHLGRTWEADRNYFGVDGDRIDRPSATVGNTRDARLYQTERYWLHGYELPIANGSYDVILHFAEFASQTVGERVMGVRVGDQYRSNIDVFATVGANRAYPIGFKKVAVTDGRLNIAFTYYTTRPPMLDGIEILRSAPSPVASCSDGLMNGTEEGVDCGGPCKACPVVDVKALVENAVAAGKSSVTIPPGVHQVSSGINIRNGNGNVVEGTGATLVFTHRGTAFNITGSGATLRGLTIDYDPLPFAQGRVIAVDATDPENKKVTLQLSDGYPDPSFITGSIAVFVFSGTSGAWKADFATVGSVTPSGRIATLNKVNSGVFGKFAIGDEVVLPPRTTTPAIQFVRGTGVGSLQGVTLHAASGIAVYGQHWDGPVRLEGFRLTPGPMPKGATRPRLISSNLDAVNFMFCRHGPEIYASEFAHQGDDGLNFHGAPFDVIRVESSDTLVLQPVIAWMDLAYIARSGDVGRRMDEDTWAVQDQAAITSVERLSENGVTRFRVHFTRALSGSGTMVDFPALNSPAGRVRGGYYHHNRARAVLPRGDGSEIIISRIEHLTGQAILLNPEYYNPNWHEAGWFNGLRIQRNFVTDVDTGIRMYGSTFPGNQNLTIQSNRFTSIRNNGIEVGEVDGAVVQNNVLQGIGKAPIVISSDALHVTSTGNVTN